MNVLWNFNLLASAKGKSISLDFEITIEHLIETSVNRCLSSFLNPVLVQWSLQIMQVYLIQNFIEPTVDRVGILTILFKNGEVIGNNCSANFAKKRIFKDRRQHLNSKLLPVSPLLNDSNNYDNNFYF